MLFCAHCEYPLNDETVYVEAASRSEAQQKIKAGVALIAGCSPDDVEIYNLDDEIECPETVLEFEIAWGGPDALDIDRRPCEWVKNPVFLLGDKARKAAYARWNAAQQHQAECNARKAARIARK